MSDEMVGPIFDEWKISNLELESEVESEESIPDVLIKLGGFGIEQSYQNRNYFSAQ